ncbi:hypothetical protein [Nocardia wallacei]|uniref:hypothetical protein n=1 Tax=Nocardia wallacei TaxID=480035 RepID=UPI002456ADFE|nr:hypothetical protein [Nocardia wallacei]
MGQHSAGREPWSPDEQAGQIPATQVVYPWRATARTVFQLVVGLAVALPTLVALLGLPPSAGLAGALGVAAVFTRVMAMPEVEALLRRFAPWLAAEPRD